MFESGGGREIQERVDSSQKGRNRERREGREQEITCWKLSWTSDLARALFGLGVLSVTFKQCVEEQQRGNQFIMPNKDKVSDDDLPIDLIRFPQNMQFKLTIYNEIGDPHLKIGLWTKDD